MKVDDELSSFTHEWQLVIVEFGWLTQCSIFSEVKNNEKQKKNHRFAMKNWRNAEVYRPGVIVIAVKNSRKMTKRLLSKCDWFTACFPSYFLWNVRLIVFLLGVIVGVRWILLDEAVLFSPLTSSKTSISFSLWNVRVGADQNWNPRIFTGKAISM